MHKLYTSCGCPFQMKSNIYSDSVEQRALETSSHGSSRLISQWSMNLVIGIILKPLAENFSKYIRNRREKARK